MSIKQFNGTYLVNEDRILFRFNTHNQEEYRFWFTRRVTLFVLAATSHLLVKNLEKMHSPDTAKAINTFQSEAIYSAVKNENQSTKVYESGLHFPLGFDPILVMDVTCSLVRNGEKIEQIATEKFEQIDDLVSLDFVLPGGSNLNLKLDQSTLEIMRILLDQIRVQAGWGDAILQLKTVHADEDKSDMNSSKNISIH